MKRYSMFVLWTFSWGLGGWVAGNSFVSQIPALLAIFWGCVMTNFFYGKKDV